MLLFCAVGGVTGTESSNAPTALSGNKVKKYGIANQSDCICRPQFSLSFF